MTKFKKFAALFISAVMCLTLALFTACGPTDGPGKDPDKDPDKDPQPGTSAGYEGSTPEITAFINSMADRSVENFDFLYETSSNNVSSVYTVEDGEGKTKLMEYTTDSKETVQGKINLATGDADLYLENSFSTTGGGEETSSESYIYAFLRDWNAFSLEPEDEEGNSVKLESFEGQTLVYNGNLDEILQNIEGLPEDLEGYVSMISADMLATIAGGAIVPVAGFSPAIVADIFGALTFDGVKYTANINKLVYNAVIKIGKIIDSLTVSTSLSDLLVNKDFKDIVSPFVNMMSAEEIHSAITATIATIAENEEIAAILGDIDLSTLDIAPDKDSTGYDYLVKFICSEELNDVIKSVLIALNPQFAALQAVNFVKLPISVFLGENITVDQIKAAYKQMTAGITETQITIGKTVIKNSEICYTVTDGELSAIEFAFSVVNKGEKEEGSMPGGAGVVVEYVTETEMTLALDFPKTEYDFADISDNEVAVVSYSWTDDCNTSRTMSFADTDESDFGNLHFLRVTLTVENGAPVLAYEISDADENYKPLTPDNDGGIGGGKYIVTEDGDGELEISLITFDEAGDIVYLSSCYFEKTATVNISTVSEIVEQNVM